MARPRVTDQEAVLDAAEVVVGRDGAAHMTLDAVALEAGISKASVIYDYGSKQCLIKAVIERRIRTEAERVRSTVAALGDVQNAEILGRVSAAASPGCSTSQAVSLNLCFALAQDTELRRCMHSFYREQIDAVLHDAANPREAMIAFLAVEGLKVLECFGFFHWTDEGRLEILADVAALVATPAAAREADS